MRTERVLRASLVAASICVVLGACGVGETPAARDLLLITIDTARVDRFGYAGATGGLTPRIDALATAGAGFTQAISPAPLTLPAHATLMTGRQPPSHTVRDNGGFRLPASEVTLAELLREGGFETAAFVGAQVLDARYGLDQGFDTYDDTIAAPADSPFRFYAERPAGEVVAAAIDWLDGRDAPRLFAWVHLFDPHAPYRPPQPEASRHASAYDGEIAYVDRSVGVLLDAWQAQRGLERTLVVVTADHGEALGEHGEPTHGVLVHDATLLVPLVIQAPGHVVAAPIDTAVSLADVLPTVLALLDRPPTPNVQGRDLSDLLRGKTLPWSSATGYAESLYGHLHHGTLPLVALREPDFKLVRGRAEELFDLRSDPRESRDIAATRADVADALSERLDALLEDLYTGSPERLALDAESRAALSALGYTGWSAEVRTDAEPRDAREALVSMRRMAEADRAFLSGDLEGAHALYAAVIADEPESIDARVRWAALLQSAGRAEEALGPLREAVELAPHEAELHRQLGRALEKLGRSEAALAAFDVGLALHPSDRALRDGRWRCLNALRRAQELLEEAERAIALDPLDGMARFARAVACCGATQAGYLAALAAELRELPGDPHLERALAQAHSGASGGDTTQR